MSADDKLVLSEDLHLPLDAVTQTFGFIGRKGAGKTYAAGKLVEELFDRGAPVVVLDPVGNWWGLRMAADGKGDGLPIPIFGGDHGDLPLHSESGRIVASTLLAWKHCSAVLDVSGFRKNERERFVADFAEEFFHEAKKIRRPVMLVLEEAQKFCPQHSRGSERIVGAIEDIVRLGRNYGIGAALLSQRPQSVNKEVLNQVECLLVGQLAGKHERKAIEDWIVEKDIHVSASELPKLRVGEMFVWSPQWLDVFEKIRIAKKRTYDASETPKLGAIRGGVKLAKLDIESLRKNMEAMIEKASEDDPVALRRKIASLEGQLRAKRVVVEDEGLKRIVASEIEEAQRHIRTAGALTEHLDEAFNVLVRSLSRLKSDSHPTRIPLDVIRKRSETLRPYLEADAKLMSPNGLKRGMREMLFVLSATGPLTKRNLAVLSVISPTSGSYSTYLSVLRTRGLIIENEATGCIERTKALVGDLVLDEGSTFLSRKGLIERWEKKLHSIGKAGTLRMFEVLVESYPQEMSRKELAIRSGMNLSGSFSTYLSILRTNRLIDEIGSRKLIRLTKTFDIADKEGRGA